MPPSTTLRCRVASVTDVDALSALDALSHNHPWTRGNFVDAVNAGYWVQILERQQGDASPRVLAYYVAMPVVDEAHLLNLTVAPNERRQGLGRYLLDSLQAWARVRGINSLWLEVRPSNAAAQRLYTRYGFEVIGRRKHYYAPDNALSNEREDALLMCLPLATAQ